MNRTEIELDPNNTNVSVIIELYLEGIKEYNNMSVIFGLGVILTV